MPDDLRDGDLSSCLEDSSYMVRFDALHTKYPQTTSICQEGVSLQSFQLRSRYPLLLMKYTPCLLHYYSQVLMLNRERPN